MKKLEVLKRIIFFNLVHTILINYEGADFKIRNANHSQTPVNCAYATVIRSKFPSIFVCGAYLYKIYLYLYEK